MKAPIFKITVFLLFLALMGAGCKDEKVVPQLKNKQLTVREANSIGCKANLESTETKQYIELKAEGKKQLRLKFINATINCAGLDTTYAIIQDGILKVAFLDKISANCNCKFDLECLIDSLENRSYEIEIYAHSEKAKAKFTFTYFSELDSKKSINDN